MKRAEREAAEIMRKTGRKKRIVEVGGGGIVVRQLMENVLKSLKVAVDKYRKAFEEQTKEMEREGAVEEK